MSGAGKTVFITGCSSGIGRSCVKYFAQAGFRVVATARNPETLRDLEQWSDALSGPVRTTACDVSSEESMRAAVRFAKESFGRIDVLVNNAGFGLFGPIELLPMDSARHQLEVNAFGPMRLVQLIAGDMRAAGWGRIINVSSVAGRISVPMGGWYSASKHALEALSDALRLELRAFGIETISVMPGPVATEFVANVQVPVQDQESVPGVYRKIGDSLRKRNAGHRRGTVSADRVAAAIVRAATAAKPKTRYYITARNRASVRLRQLLPDRRWDKLIASFYKISDAIKPRKENTTV